MKKLMFVTFVGIFTLCNLICCNKNGVNGGKIPEPKPEPDPVTETYATFTIIAENATTGFDPLGEWKDEGDTVNAKIAPGDLCILVFNRDNILEYKAEMESATHSALLSTGVKHVFVLANLGSTSSHLMGNLKRVNLATLDPDEATATTYSDFIVGATTLNDLYSTAFDAGTPQAYDYDKNSPRTFNLAPLATHIDNTHGLPMSNGNRYTFTLNPNVTKMQAETPGTPVSEGSELYNRFAVHLNYLCAKVRLVMSPEMYTGVTYDGEVFADISNPAYTIRNLAKYTSLIQNDVGNAYGWLNQPIRSIYHNFWAYQFPSPHTPFIVHLDQASDGVFKVPAENGPFIYVPEYTYNDSDRASYRGQQTIFVVSLTFKPKKIVKSVIWDAQREGVAYNCDSWDALSSVGANLLQGGNQYLYYDFSIQRNGTYYGPESPFFANKQVLADALWMELYGDPDGSNHTPANALDMIWDDTLQEYIGPYANHIWTYTDAQSWYRYGMPYLLRGHAYTVSVVHLNFPGYPQEEMCWMNPNDPYESYLIVETLIESERWSP